MQSYANYIALQKRLMFISEKRDIVANSFKKLIVDNKTFRIILIIDSKRLLFI